MQAGKSLVRLGEASGDAHKFFFYTSPYRRSIETYRAMAHEVPEDRILGVQEEVQLREQDFGNFQDATGKAAEKSERLRFGRFFYRFPNGESGADVYDRCGARDACPRTATGAERGQTRITKPVVLLRVADTASFVLWGSIRDRSRRDPRAVR